MPRNRSKKHPIPTNPWIAPLLKLGAIAVLSPIVASRRVADVQAGKSTPEEATRMVTEKIVAFGQGFTNATGALLRTQLSLTSACWAAVALPLQTSGAKKRTSGNKSHQARLARTVANTADRALAPVARTVKANAKRLTRKKP